MLNYKQIWHGIKPIRWLNKFNLTLFIWLLTIHIIWSFWINTTYFEQYILFLRLMPEIFDISMMNKPLAFGHQYKSLSLFSSQTLVCATAFPAHYLFSFWDLHLLSSLSNKNKRVGRDISTSLRMYQNQHDYWLIIHDKFEDRFTTITQRCQDFSHKDINAKRTS